MKARTRSRLIVVGLLIVALVQPCWSLALTTFGKSSPQNNKQQDNNNDRQSGERNQARECASDSECAGIKGASCLESIFANNDNKMRCLCGNYREPRNGLCSNELKRVHVLCNGNEECTPGAQCIVGNSTLAGKRCYCMQGFVADVDMQCSDGGAAVIGLSALSLMASLLIAGNV